MHTEKAKEVLHAKHFTIKEFTKFMHTEQVLCEKACITS